MSESRPPCEPRVIQLSASRVLIVDPLAKPSEAPDPVLPSGLDRRRMRAKLWAQRHWADVEFQWMGTAQIGRRLVELRMRGVLMTLRLRRILRHKTLTVPFRAERLKVGPAKPVSQLGRVRTE